MFHRFAVRNPGNSLAPNGQGRTDASGKVRSLSVGRMVSGTTALALFLCGTAGITRAASAPQAGSQAHQAGGQNYGPDFAAISFATARSGWVAGPGLIWHTGDAGRTWLAQYAGRLRIEGLQALSTRVVDAWSPTTLLASYNGGASWQIRFRPKGTILDVSALSQRALYVATSSGLYVTQNGGASWARVPSRMHLVQVVFSSPSQGWGLTATGRVVRTEDGGRTWTVSFALPGGPSQGLSAAQDRLAAAGPDDAWVLYSGGSGMNQTSYSVYHTADGKHWRGVVAVPTAGAGPAPGNPAHASSGPEIPGGMGSSPGPLAVLPDGTAYLVGECRACTGTTSDVVRTRDGGLGWTHPVLVKGASGFPTMSDLSFPTRNTGWLAVPGGYAYRGKIYVTHDGGRRWDAVWPHEQASASTPGTTHVPGSEFPAVVTQSLVDVLKAAPKLPVGAPAFLPPEPPSRLYLTATTTVSPGAWTVHILTAVKPYAVDNPALAGAAARPQTVASFGVAKSDQRIPPVGRPVLLAYLWQASLTTSGLEKDALGPLLPAQATSRPVDLGLGIQGRLLTMRSGVDSLVWHEGDWTLVVRDTPQATSVPIARRVVAYLHKAYMPPHPGLVVIGVGVHGVYTRIDWVDGGYLYHIVDDLAWGQNPVAACEMAVDWKAVDA